MKKIAQLLLGVIIIIALAGYFRKPTVTVPSQGPQVVIKSPINTGGNTFAFDEPSYDFGLIKQSEGKVQHTFSFQYLGEDPIVITKLNPSCLCTAAQTDSTTLVSGQTGHITVVFNPNLHAEPEGRFFKSVLVSTEPALAVLPEVKIRVEIDLDLGEEAFELKNDDHND